MVLMGKILIVEDDDRVADDTREIVEFLGYEAELELLAPRVAIDTRLVEMRSHVASVEVIGGICDGLYGQWRAIMQLFDEVQKQAMLVTGDDDALQQAELLGYRHRGRKPVSIDEFAKFLDEIHV